MTDHILDTNALLIMALESEHAPPSVREAFSQGRRFVSQVCAIEIAIKQSIGKLRLPPPFETDFAYAFNQLARKLGAQILPRTSGISRRRPVCRFTTFDRLIIAQTLVEDLSVVTRDRASNAYAGLKIVGI